MPFPLIDRSLPGPCFCLLVAYGFGIAKNCLIVSAQRVGSFSISTVTRYIPNFYCLFAILFPRSFRVYGLLQSNYTYA